MKPSQRNKRLADLLAPAAATEATPAVSPEPVREPHRVGAGAVGALKDSLAHLMREGRVIEVDVDDVDPSPFPDRLESFDGGEQLALLTESIRSSGQEVPVLLRPHPTLRGRFQLVYGHRRLKAVAAIEGLKLRAIVREMDDGALLLAQGIENSARQDLSWIEKAMFAAELERYAARVGQDPTRLVTEALSIHAPDASRFRTTLEAIPGDVIAFIGAAPRIGRTKWLALADRLKERPDRLRALRSVIASQRDPKLTSDQRFARMLEAALADANLPPEPAGVQPLSDPAGREIASFQEFSRGARLQIADKGFARYVAARMAALYTEFIDRPNPGPEGEEQ